MKPVSLLLLSVHVRLTVVGLAATAARLLGAAGPCWTPLGTRLNQFQLPTSPLPLFASSASRMMCVPAVRLRPGAATVCHPALAGMPTLPDTFVPSIST